MLKVQAGRSSVESSAGGVQANIVKQLAKLVKVRYVEDITDARRVGPHLSLMPSVHLFPSTCNHSAVAS